MFRWFEDRLDPFPDTEVVEPPKTLVAFCRYYTQGAWLPILLMAGITSTIAACEVWLFGFMGNLVDWLSAQSKETLFEERGGVLLTLGALVLFGLPLLALIHSLLTHQTLLGNYPMRIRWKVHRYLLGQSLAFFHNEFSGRVATKLMQTALAVREAVLKLLDVINYVAVYFAGAVVIVAGFDPWLVLPFVVWFVAYVALLRYYVPRLRVVSELQADARSTMTGRIVDSYTNIQTVKLFSHAEREEQYAKQAMAGFLKTVHAQMRLVTAFWVILYVLNSALLVGVSAIALELWLGSAISLGAIAVGIGLVMRLHGMSQWIMWEVSALFENIGTVQDGMASISTPRRVRDVEDAPPLIVKRGRVEFEHVSFSYPGGEQVFKDLDLTIDAGARVGIIGRSGAGKSTFVNLLLRFYNLDSGRIFVDGQDISRIKQETLRAQIGVVTQDTSLLHRSIRENLIYGRPDATDDMVREAARKADAEEFIEQLEDIKGRTGYEAHVGERGVNLSGGQRQRIAIGRVILKDAPILILDEATSALDSEAEAAIQESLDKLMKNKTVVAIAHRLSTIAALDRLIVFDGGRIVEDGSHDELLALGGIYAKLWARQSGGFLGVDVVDPPAIRPAL
jgi:ATP-binding cassette subfamily B multidrug efflux pump